MPLNEKDELYLLIERAADAMVDVIHAAQKRGEARLVASANQVYTATLALAADVEPAAS